MADYVLSCCATADLTPEWMERRNLSYVNFHMELDGKQYPDDMGKTITPEILFSSMAAGAMTRTSQVTIGEYEEYFRGFLEKGKDVLHLTLSSGISGTYNSAMIAQRELAQEFPDRKLYIVDSLGASSGIGLLLDKLADLRDEGQEIDQVYAWVEANKKRVRHSFFSTDLTYYIRGGRVSKASGTIGNFLGICPLLEVDAAGKLVVKEKVRGKKKVMKRSLELLLETIDQGADYTDQCFISHSDCLEEAGELAGMIQESLPKMKGKVEIFSIGATIGSHTGPGTIAIFYWGKERSDG